MINLSTEQKEMLENAFSSIPENRRTEPYTSMEGIYEQLKTSEEHLKESGFEEPYTAMVFYGKMENGKFVLNKLIVGQKEPVVPHYTTEDLSGREPTEQEIQEYMKENNENYYNARERLRENAYGGKPPGGYRSWGDYWKSY